MKYFLLFVCVIHVTFSCTLFTLYKDSDRQLIVKEHLGRFFKHKFFEVTEEARIRAPYLLRPAYHFKGDIQKYFLNFGADLNNWEDLEKILKSFNYLNFEDFKEWKSDWEKSKRDFIQ